MNKYIRLIRYDYPMHLVLLLTNWLPDSIPFMKLRGYLVGKFLGECSANFRLGRNITFYNPREIKIGKNVYIAQGCWFCAGAEIHIDDEVIIGPYTVVVSSNHTRLKNSYRYGTPINDKIYIGKGTWIAAHCTIMAGSHISSGCLIAANTAIAKRTDSNELWAGSPAMKKKRYE